MTQRKRKKIGPNPGLAAACAKNLPLNLWVIGEHSPALYKSRFLGQDERSGETVVFIEAPADKGNIVPIRPGRQVKAIFTLNGQDYYFETSVLDRGKFQLNPQTSVPSLELQAPEEVLAEAKRGFYRVAIDAAEPIELRLGILAEDQDGGGRIRWRERGTLTDVGGGGLGFRISEGKSLLISPATRLLLRFKLDPEDEEIKLMGRVCFSLRQPELREAFFGVQFIDVESDVEYKRNIDRILHFVAETQRLSLGERTQRGE